MKLHELFHHANENKLAIINLLKNIDAQLIIKENEEIKSFDNSSSNLFDLAVKSNVPEIIHIVFEKIKKIPSKKIQSTFITQYRADFHSRFPTNESIKLLEDLCKWSMALTYMSTDEFKKYCEEPIKNYVKPRSQTLSPSSMHENFNYNNPGFFVYSSTIIPPLPMPARILYPAVLSDNYSYEPLTFPSPNPEENSRSKPHKSRQLGYIYTGKLQAPGYTIQTKQGSVEELHQKIINSIQSSIVNYEEYSKTLAINKQFNSCKNKYKLAQEHFLAENPNKLTSKQENTEKQSLENEEKLYKKIAAIFPSLADYFNITQFGESGYYTDGIIKFSTATEGKVDSGDYQTHGNNYLTISHNLFKRYEEILANVTDDKQLPSFILLEIGAGNGDLCINILNYIKEQSLKSSDECWQKLYGHIHYHIIEISPALIARQKENVEKHFYQEKVTIHQGNAYALDKSDFYKQGLKADLILSNELMDMFPNHSIKRHGSGEITAKWIIPSITKELAKKELGLNKNEIEVLAEKSDRYKELIQRINKGFIAETPISVILLSKSDFQYVLNIFHMKAKAILESTGDSRLVVNVFSFDEFAVPVKVIPEINEFLHEYPILLDTLKTGKSKLICPLMQNYIKGLKLLLKETTDGNIPMIITIDYGNITHLSKTTLRSFGRFKQNYFSEDIYDMPGFIDVTQSVDLTLVSKIAKNHEFDCLIIPETEIGSEVLQDNKNLKNKISEPYESIGQRKFPAAILIKSCHSSKLTFFHTIKKDVLVSNDLKIKALAIKNRSN